MSGRSKPEPRAAGISPSLRAAVAILAAAASFWSPVPVTAEEGLTMEDRCRREVVELHRFFQDWFNAELEDERDGFSRLEQALGEDFEIIGPEGRRVARSTVVEMIRGGHGRDRERDFAIEVRNLDSRTIADGLVIVTYEEHQNRAGEPRAWLSSAVFRERPGNPHGVEWVHVQETYLPDE